MDNCIESPQARSNGGDSTTKTYLKQQDSQSGFYDGSYYAINKRDGKTYYVSVIFNVGASTFIPIT